MTEPPAGGNSVYRQVEFLSTGSWTGLATSMTQKKSNAECSPPGSAGGREYLSFIGIRMIAARGARSLKKSQTIHHIGFLAENLDEELTRLRKLGSRALVSPQPGEAFENTVFVYAGLGLNIEFIDNEKRAKLIET